MANDDSYQPALHFVGFRGAEYHAAVKVWGKPDFIHRNNDPRWVGDVAPGDTVVFALGCEARPTQFAFNDSEWEIFYHERQANTHRPRR